MNASTVTPRSAYLWSVRRELWDFRPLLGGPVIAGGVVLVGFVLSALQLPQNRLETLTLEPARQAVAIALPYDLAALAIIATSLIIGAVYCVGALYNERRDRSILFWKSLPVSDLTTVLAKAILPVAILPAVAAIVILVTHALMLAITTAILMMSGMDPSSTWTRLPFGSLVGAVIWGAFAMALWYAPLWGWLLMVSGWARRGPFLWAFLTPLALALIEKLAFGSGHVISEISYRLGGLAHAFTIHAHGHTPLDPVPVPDPAGFLTNPDVWIGLVVAAACLGVGVWQRRYRDPV